MGLQNKEHETPVVSVPSDVTVPQGMFGKMVPKQRSLVFAIYSL